MNTPRAIRIHAPGGPEVLRWEEIPVPDPGPGEVLVRHEAIGLNYGDIYRRSGIRATATLPAVIGVEAAGVVEAVGPRDEDAASADQVAFQIGDRVGYCTVLGAYCRRRVIPAHHLIQIPDGFDFAYAAAAMLRGMTAWYLCRRTYRVKAGDPVLVHAAAGGVGTILSQWCKALNATVIGTVGSEEKARLARENGCDHVILYDEEDFVERVDEITGGEGVPVVFDGVGAATFDDSLRCLRSFGTMIAFGNTSGAVMPLNLQRLMNESLTVTYPSAMTHLTHRTDLLEAAAALFGYVLTGRIRIVVGQRFPLAEAAEAHRALASRRTRGSTVLLP